MIDNHPLPISYFHLYFETVFSDGGASALLAVPAYLAKDDVFGDVHRIAKILDKQPFGEAEFIEMSNSLHGIGDLSNEFTLEQRSKAIRLFESQERIIEAIGNKAFRSYLRMIGEYLGFVPVMYPNSTKEDRGEGINWVLFAEAIYDRIKKI